jgi:3-deoxy-D-manno-octulosonic-acid transferase
LIALYYYCVFLILLLAWPILLIKKKTRVGLGQKLGFIPAAIKAKGESLHGCVWFHAVSVGEFNAILPLVKAFNAKHPERPLVVSTTTATGQKLAQEKLGDLATIIFFPLDLPGAINAWLKVLKPDLIVIAETEIWPGFTYECRKRGVKMMVVNGRMSPRSFKSYHRHRRFFGPVLKRFSAIGVQTPEEASRYFAVGGDDLPVTALGNIKFDGLQPLAAEVSEKLLAKLGLTAAGSLSQLAHEYGSGPPPTPVLVAGSTHEGEEVCVLKAYAQLLDTTYGARAKLIIVPRHPERFERVAELIREYDFIPRRFSEDQGFSSDQPHVPGSKAEVYLLDVIGKLFDFYSLASVAFVGGTLAPVGGHNIMEPYAYGVPVVVGPRTEKVKDLTAALTAQNAISQGKNEAGVIACLLSFFADEKRRTEAGLAGREILIASQGAVVKALALIESQLPVSKLSDGKVSEDLKGDGDVSTPSLEEAVRER